MPKCFSYLAHALKKGLRVYSYRNYSSEIKGGWNEAPLCKGRKIVEPEHGCYPKELSCTARLGSCTKYDMPECGYPDAFVPRYLQCCNDKRLTEKPCDKPPKPKPMNVEHKPFKSMWDVGFPAEDRCPQFVERTDDIHYKPSDKVKRVYTKTWTSCRDIVRIKKVCCLEELGKLKPPFDKRSKPKRSEPAGKNIDVDYGVVKKCMVEERNPNLPPLTTCPKINMPCCRAVAKSLTCFPIRRHKICEKDCCPYPSYSECDYPKPSNLHPVECRCRHFVNQCDINSYNKRRSMYSIPPPLPAWPPKERPK